jgi:hypothetical protein
MKSEIENIFPAHFEWLFRVPWSSIPTHCASDAHIMVAAFTVQGDSIVADKPRLWLEKQIRDTAGNQRNFDLAPDGKRITR